MPKSENSNPATDAPADAPAAESAENSAPPAETTFAELAATKPQSRDDLMAAESLSHDMVDYKVGDVISRGVFSDAQFNQLRKDGVIKFRHEMADAATIAQEIADQADLISALRAKLVEMGVNPDNL